MCVSGTSRKGKADVHLQTVENPVHTCQQKARKASQMVTHTLFKTQSMLLSATGRKSSQKLNYSLLKTQSMLLSVTSRKSQRDADLQPFQNIEHGHVSNIHEGLARC
jgi:hypothetical protein